MPATPEDPTEEASGAACGVERQAVKTGRDATAATIDLTHAQDTTVAALGQLPAPVNPGSRVRGPETTLWQVHATVRAYKREADSDYHLALVDSSGATMIAELAAPSCVGSSIWAPQIAAARAAFDHNLQVAPRFRTTNLAVTVTGIGFFDVPHGQRGMAPNAIELHPVLSVSFP